MKNKLAKAWSSTVEFFVPYLGWMETMALGISVMMSVMMFIVTLITNKDSLSRTQLNSVGQLIFMLL